MLGSILTHIRKNGNVMAIIKKDITLGAIVENIHSMDYELSLTNEAKNLISGLDIGSELERNALKSYIETFLGDGSSFNEKAKEWGFEENVDAESFVLAAFSQFLSVWKTPGFDTTIDSVSWKRGKTVAKKIKGFQLSCGRKTSDNRVHVVETDNDDFVVFISKDPKLNLNSQVISDLEIKHACDIAIPNIEIEIEKDYTESFDGSKAVVEGECYDIDCVATKAKIKLDKVGVEVKQMSKMVMSFSGCMGYVEPVVISDDFRLVVAKKEDTEHVVLFDFLIEAEDFKEA